ncbi:hypothetical protein MAFF301069_25540 [Ralstonia pseudosolanacearum]|nr:hypothetical protein MAFF301560_25860 [Ralstonia solanacearum]BEU46049.1 hypothetical protein MAFF211519_13740 [Ralstonia pseudosolanacearum]BEU67999.1 hypothetical protein MAFF301069_25540 [Ralstonia pseudosolanacearum]
MNAMHQTQGKVSLQFAREHAEEIVRVTHEHGLEEPRYVDYGDPKYDLTLLVRPNTNTSLLDLTAAMVELEDRLHHTVFIITETELSKRGQDVPFHAIVRTV